MAKEKTLLQKIETLRAELEATISEHVKELARANPGVPAESIRQLVDHNSLCVCTIVRRLTEDGQLE
jgi:hypothetical protein